ncbi:PIN domain-containing protein [Streptomyces hydrogenans]|uniref:PIN domain-containing protein n=1 Tax=Streptomyces hydrogenans TaxID=1873719 RepID=UPI0036254AAC
MTRRSRKASQTLVPPGAVVLDCEALSRALSKDREFVAYLAALKDDGRVFAISALTILEAHRGKINRATLDHYLSDVHVIDVTEDDARMGVELLGDRQHGHKYAIDAAIAAMCIRIRAHQIITSDSDDMERLLADTGIKVVQL